MYEAWFQLGNNSVYGSNKYSMVCFGLLIYNKGKWENQRVINENYHNETTNTSQTINIEYDYLRWLNGKSSCHLP